MNRVEVLFSLIDVLAHPLQNYIKVKGLEHKFDVPYANDYPEQKMDLIFRKSDKALPVLINMHGGGFVKGDKKHRHSICDMFADKGWFVINTNYRLSPKHVFPALVEDMFILLNGLEDLSSQYNLNLAKVVFTGDSAGAYLSAMVVACLTNETLRNALKLPEVNIIPAGLIGFCGPYDLVKAMAKPMAFGLTECMAKSFTGLSVDRDVSKMMDNYEYVKYVSPVNFVTEKWCPSLIVYAEQDLFCKGLELELIENIKNAGVYCTEAHSTKALDNHCYHFNYWTKVSKEALKKAFEFLDYVAGLEVAVN
jgi:acetyl esterase/lipase